MTAELPNLYNESVFRLLMDYEIKRSQRYVSPLAMLRLAIVMDHPTKHELEDAPSVLANLLNSRLRAADLPAKLEEGYAVLLPSTDEAGARAVCERFLSAATGTHFTPNGQTTRLGICIGMTSHVGGPTLQADKLFKEAEAALLKARQLGPQHYMTFAKLPNGSS
jgi:diguanylate cyclase (GGDEF)-like protein